MARGYMPERAQTSFGSANPVVFCKNDLFMTNRQPVPNGIPCHWSKPPSVTKPWHFVARITS